MMARYRVFVSFFFCQVLQSLTINERNQNKDHNRPHTWGLTIVSAKSKIYSPRQGYLSPGNSIILEIAATLLFIGFTIFCWFWGSFCWNSSTLPTDLFIFVSNIKNILLYHISTLSSKIQYTTWYDNSQRQKISGNPFPAKHFIETNNIRCTTTPSTLHWLSTPLLVNENNKLTRQNVYLYLIKLAQQKDANLILTRKCFTIAIKTIQLSSHIIKHDEFIKATFSIFWNKQHICY